MEVHAVFDFRGVRVTELLVNPLLLGELLVVFDFERHVMRRTGAENPAARRTIRFMQQRHGLGRAALADFEAVIGALLPGLLESQCVDEESLRLRYFADRQHRTVKTARADVAADFADLPRSPLVLIVLDDFELNARRMIEADVLLPEALLNAAVLHLVTVQMVEPEFRRAFRNGVRRGLHLPGTLVPSHTSIRKGGVDRPWFCIRVRVIEMVVGVAAVKENGLLDHALPKNLRLKVDIFLSARDADGHVMETFYERHIGSPPAGILSNDRKIRQAGTAALATWGRKIAGRMRNQERPANLLMRGRPFVIKTADRDLHVALTVFWGGVRQWASSSESELRAD